MTREQKIDVIAGLTAILLLVGVVMWLG